MGYTLITGTKEWSSWSLRPYMALRHIGVSFAEEVVPLDTRAPTPAWPTIRPRPACRSCASKRRERRRLCGTAWRSARRWPSATPARSSGRPTRWCAPSRAPMRRRCIPVSRICASSCRWISCAACRCRRCATRRRPRSRASGRPGARRWPGTAERTVSCSRLLHRRLHVRAGRVALHHLWRGIAARLNAYAAKMMALPAMQDWGKAAQAEVDTGVA